MPNNTEINITFVISGVPRLTIVNERVRMRTVRHLERRRKICSRLEGNTLHVPNLPRSPGLRSFPLHYSVYRRRS